MTVIANEVYWNPNSRRYLYKDGITFLTDSKSLSHMVRSYSDLCDSPNTVPKEVWSTSFHSSHGLFDKEYLKEGLGVDIELNLLTIKNFPVYYSSHIEYRYVYDFLDNDPDLRYRIYIANKYHPYHGHIALQWILASHLIKQENVTDNTSQYFYVYGNCSGGYIGYMTHKDLMKNYIEEPDDIYYRSLVKSLNNEPDKIEKDIVNLLYNYNWHDRTIIDYKYDRMWTPLNENIYASPNHSIFKKVENGKNTYYANINNKLLEINEDLFKSIVKDTIILPDWIFYYVYDGPKIDEEKLKKLSVKEFWESFNVDVI